jgi:PAS domain-containing protein
MAERRMGTVEKEVNCQLTTLEKLTESERKYRLIADNTTDFISILTFGGICLYISPSHRLLGYRPEELVGQNGMDLIQPEDKLRLMPFLLKHAAMKLKPPPTLSKTSTAPDLTSSSSAGMSLSAHGVTMS